MSENALPPGVIHLPTRDGRLDLAQGAGPCTGCRKRGGGMLSVTVVGLSEAALERLRQRGAIPPGAEDPHAVGTVMLCGDCCAEGLAIVLGRRHVQAGGRIEDLG